MMKTVRRLDQETSSAMTDPLTGSETMCRRVSSAATINRDE